MKELLFKKAFTVAVLVPVFPVLVASILAWLPIYAVVLIAHAILKGLGPTEEERQRAVFWRHYIDGDSPRDAGRKS